MGAVKRKSSENNGNLVSKQAKSCSEVALLFLCHLYEALLNSCSAWPVCLVVIRLSSLLIRAVVSALSWSQILAIISMLKQMEII